MKHAPTPELFGYFIQGKGLLQDQTRWQLLLLQLYSWKLNIL